MYQPLTPDPLTARQPGHGNAAGRAAGPVGIRPEAPYIDWPQRLGRLLEVLRQPDLDVRGKIETLRLQAFDLAAEIRLGDGYPEFLRYVETQPPAAPLPWYRLTLWQSNALRAGVLGVYRGFPLPLHDHPGAFGALIPLRGRGAIQQFDRGEPFAGSDHLLKLERSAGTQRSGLPLAVHSMDSGNIHGIQALTPRVIYLSLRFSLVAGTPRSLYLPTEQPGVYIRVASRPSQPKQGVA